MAGRERAALTAAVALILAACGSGGPGSSGASACKATTEAGAVAVSIEDFAFVPPAIQAKIGQVIAFMNTGFESHNATFDTGGCATTTLQTGTTDGLVFTVAGSYPFHCTVHAQMTGTITIGA